MPIFDAHTPVNPQGRLAGKVVYITGAGAAGAGWGNGRATAIRFAQEGALVFGVDRNAEALRETEDSIRSAGGQFVAGHCDVMDPASIAASVQACQAALGRIDVLVNNVGGSAKGGPVEMESGFILFTSREEDRYAIEVTPGIYVSRDARLHEDISQGQGPREFLFMLGYAGWGAGQLEGELIDNSWLTVPADLDVLFRTPDEEKWARAARTFGIDIATFGDTIGYA